MSCLLTNAFVHSAKLFDIIQKKLNFEIFLAVLKYDVSKMNLIVIKKKGSEPKCQKD